MDMGFGCMCEGGTARRAGKCTLFGEVICQLVSHIDHPNFGVNFDPSNTYLAGEDPLEQGCSTHLP